MSGRERALGYIPHLDGVRALAIGLVLIAHFYALPIIQMIGLGGIGVKVFFVLSGFLITRIILRYRQDGAPISGAAKTFYWRRFLRLSPPFYAAILVFTVLGLGTMREDWIYHAFYLTNFRTPYLEGAMTGAHLWSLAVEEQFYLLWFVLIMAVPRRWLPACLVATLVIGPVYRGALFVMDIDPLWNWLLPGAIDALGIGALLALAQEDDAGRALALFRRVLRSPVFMAVSFVAAAVIGLAVSAHSLIWTTYPVALNFGAASLIAMLVQPKVPAFLNWLALPPLRGLGKISYGLYVYHGFIPVLFLTYAPGVFVEGSRTQAVAYTAISVALATLSWFALERPILKFKDAVKLPAARLTLANTPAEP